MQKGKPSITMKGQHCWHINLFAYILISFLLLLVFFLRKRFPLLTCNCAGLAYAWFCNTAIYCVFTVAQLHQFMIYSERHFFHCRSHILLHKVWEQKFSSVEVIERTKAIQYFLLFLYLLLVWTQFWSSSYTHSSIFYRSTICGNRWASVLCARSLLSAQMLTGGTRSGLSP